MFVLDFYLTWNKPGLAMLELQFNRYRASLVEYSFPSRSRTKREK